MGTQLPSPNRGQSPLAPIFGPSLLWQNVWMHQDATWYGGRPQPRRFCVRCVPMQLPQKKGHTHPHNFWPMSMPNGLMDDDAAWYGSRPRPRPHCTGRGPSSRERGTAAPLFSAHVCCGHGRPSELLLSSCNIKFSFKPVFNVKEIC